MTVLKTLQKFINSGYNAVKEIYPNAKVIVHLDQGNDANLYNRIFGYLHDNNAKWDVIGMSLYPDMYPTEGAADDWEDMNNKCIANMEKSDCQIQHSGDDVRNWYSLGLFRS